MASPGGLFSAIHALGLTVPLARFSRWMRLQLLAGVDWNPLLLTPRMAPWDLLTDSLVFNTFTPPRFFGRGHRESCFLALEPTLKSCFPFAHIVPVAQGRYAEWFLDRLLDPAGKLVVTNSLFPTTRIQHEIAGATVLECPVAEAFDPASAHPFKGDLDLVAMKTIVEREGAGRVAAIHLELANNAHGGQPVSLGNLAQVAEFARKHAIPLVLDGCRIVDNAIMIREREPGYSGQPLSAIIASLCRHADIATLSLTKNFMLEQGAVICFNEPAHKERIQDLLMLMGDGLSLRQKANIQRVVAAARRCEFADVSARARVARRLHGCLAARGVPLLQPWSTLGAYIDARELARDEGLGRHALAAFAVELYLRSGILLNERSSSPEQERRGLAALRAIVPLRSLSPRHARHIAAGIAATWHQRHAVPPLTIVSMGAGRSAIYTAKFARRERSGDAPGGATP